MRQGKLKLKSSVLNETEVKSRREEMCVGVKDGFTVLDKSHTDGKKTRNSSLTSQTDPKPKKDCLRDKSSINEDNDLDDGSSDVNKKHKCNVCGARFLRPWRLAAHQTTHTNEKPFKCDSPGCLKSYAYSNHLDRHKSRCHSDVVVLSKIQCSVPGCHLVFSSALCLQKHYKRFHDDAAYAFACPDCDSKFRKHRQLRLHMMQHTGEAPFKCKVCEWGFTHLHLLNRHMRGHKEYKCDIPGCDRKLPNQSAFRKHKAEHNACFRTMECAHCSKEFKSRSSLVAHIKTHLGEAPVFKCTYGNCERVYYQKRNLAQHVRLRHEKMTNFKCSKEGCERVFASQKKLDVHTNWHINGPAKPRPRSEPRKRRKDAGIKKRLFAAKLAGVIVPYSVEKQLLTNQGKSAFVYSDEDKPEIDIKCEQPEAKKELQDNQSESCTGDKVLANLHEGVERSEGIVISECVAEESQQTLQLSSTRVLEVCASSTDTIVESRQDGVGSFQTLGNSASGNENAPLNRSHNQSCSESAENTAPSYTSVILTTTVPVTCLENLEYSEADLITHITSPQETVLVKQAEKDDGTPLFNSLNDAIRESGSTVLDKAEDVPASPNHCTKNDIQVLLIMYENAESKSIDSSSLLINPDTVVEFADGSLSQSSSLVHADEDVPASPNHCTKNDIQVPLIMYENAESKSIDSSSLLINPDTVVEFADGSLSQSSSLVHAADYLLTGKEEEDLPVAVISNSNFGRRIDKSPCCQTNDNFSINKMNITESSTANVSSQHVIKSIPEKLLTSNKYDDHYSNLGKMRKISAKKTVEDLAVHQLAKVVYSFSSNMSPKQFSPKVKISSSMIIEKFSSDCVMDLPGPVRGHADDQEDSDSAEEDHGEAHDENSDSDRDDDSFHPDDHAEEEHAGGEGNGGDEDDGDDDDDEDDNDNENHDDDEVDGDGDEDDDENESDNDDNHGAQEQNDGNEDNNNSNDSNCDSSSDGNRTIGGQTDSESSNDSHSFGDGSDMGIDRALPPVTDRDAKVQEVIQIQSSEDERDVKVQEVIEVQSSEDEEVDVENFEGCEISLERSALDSLEEKKPSIEFNSDPSPIRQSAGVKCLQSRKRIVTTTEVSQAAGLVVEASEQAAKPIIQVSMKKTKSKLVTQPSNKPNNNEKQGAISPVSNIHIKNSAMKEVITQQDITARTGVKRSCSDELPPAKKFMKITESGRITCGVRLIKDSKKDEKKDLSAKHEKKDVSAKHKKKEVSAKHEKKEVSAQHEKREQSQRKACSELTEESWLNILRQTKDLWKLNAPSRSKTKIK